MRSIWHVGVRHHLQQSSEKSSIARADIVTIDVVTNDVDNGETLRRRWAQTSN